ncbi:MAG: Uma2 family endonuclease [Nevskiaceae bacterium]|jgi:Uma2 family endonuclease|nr:Uma2 family endonuclease [Nevskiaceae bacterium]
MGNAATQPRMTAEEFLAWEAGQVERHEFVDGEVFAMSGAEARHVTACMNVAFALRQHLADRPCDAYMSDMKVAAANKRDFFYPDVVVTCSPADQQDRLVVVQEPTLIVEVLSPSTAAYDLGDKFAHYQDIPSLREIAFIDLDLRRTSVHRKGADGLWVLHRFDAGMDVRFASVDLTITAEALFAKVRE